MKISQIRALLVERLSRKIGRTKPEEVELAITGPNQIVAPSQKLEKVARASHLPL